MANTIRFQLPYLLGQSPNRPEETAWQKTKNSGKDIIIIIVNRQNSMRGLHKLQTLPSGVNHYLANIGQPLQSHTKPIANKILECVLIYSIHMADLLTFTDTGFILILYAVFVFKLLSQKQSSTNRAQK